MQLLVEGAAKLGIRLSDKQVALFDLYYRTLSEWNRKTNLTAITGFEEVQVKHFLDSLSIAVVLPQVTRETRLLDVGSGAGFPGVPLKIAFPELRVVLLESVGKKADFLLHLVNSLSLEGVEVIAGRAEELAHEAEYREAFGLVVSRAVAALPVLLELTLPFCQIGGLVVAPKSDDVQQEIDASVQALEVLGGRLVEVRRMELPRLEKRVLVVISKVGPTPPRYPRRAGMPAKRPISHKAN